MKEYVWALHDFLPQISDEVPFKAGERIEVVEKDDLYQDGWWKGINTQGREGLFPRSYTTDVPPSDTRPQPAEDRTPVAFPEGTNEPTLNPSVLPVVREESDTGTNGTFTPHGHADERERTLSTGEAAMQATLTDVQQAIEQLGRTNDHDGTRSFSFRSSHDGYTDRSDTGTDVDESEGEDGTEWHKSAREKLALRAQRENEQRLRDSGSVPSTPMRVTAPPIDVELSDESDDEAEEPAHNVIETTFRRHSEGVSPSQYTHHYPHIPEEDETAEEPAMTSKSLAPVRASTEDRSATIVPSLPSAAATIPTIPSVSHALSSPESEGGHIVPSEDYIVPSPSGPDDEPRTATADRTTFPDVPFSTSPDPSPGLSAYSKSAEPSPMPPLAPTPAALLAVPPQIPSIAPIPEEAPAPTPISETTILPVPASEPTAPIAAAAPEPVSALVPEPTPTATSPAQVPTFLTLEATPTPTSSVPLASAGVVMPGSLNPLSPTTPEREPILMAPLAPAPTISPSTTHAAAIKLAPVATRIPDSLSVRSGLPSPGFPLPSPSVSSSGSVGFNGSSGIQQTLSPATTPLSYRAGGYSTPGQEASPGGSQDGARKSPSTHPSEWSIEEVVDWLKSKGFDQSVCDKFIDQEITGDVLLELTPTILKDEIGITKWGQRQRIANAITELNRPRSFVEYEQPSMPALATSRSQSFNYGHSHTSSMQSSALPSYNNSPMGYVGPGFSPSHSTHAIPSTLVNMPPTGFSSFGSPESPGYHLPPPVPEIPVGAIMSQNGWMAPQPGAPGQASEVTLQNVQPQMPVPERSQAAGLGFPTPSSPPASRPQSPGIVPGSGSKLHTGQMSIASAPQSQSVTAVGDSSSTAATPTDHGAMSDSETAQLDSKVKRRRLWGRSSESASLKEKAASLKETGSRLSKDSPTALTPTNDSSSKISAGDEAPPTRRHSKKRSVDSKPSDRLSLFGGSFSGAITGKKARKPVPRLSSSTDGKPESSEKRESVEKAEKAEKEHDWTGLATFSRMRHGSERKASGRPATSDGTPKKREEKPPASPEQKKRDSGLLRKRTSSNSEPGSRSPATPPQIAVGGAPVKPGKSILEQIGTPDHKGWMRKKSDHYNTWKNRFFVLKGPHLYCLKSNDRTETKIKGYVNIIGYKVVADENIDPGRYGFRIVHDSDKPHYFSHEEQSVIREWMKALIKATISRDYASPVVSSSNIPTIPLTVAQAMNPSPRPPSPTARAATQRAHRRENPNQLSSRDAQILLGMPPANGAPQSSDRPKPEPLIGNGLGSKLAEPTSPRRPLGSPKVAAPPRPSRELRRKLTSPPPEDDFVADDDLIDWANSHLPNSLQITDPNGPLCGGLGLLRIAEDIKGVPSSPSVRDSDFPIEGVSEKLDGLFALFDYLLDNDVKFGAVSINDIRQGKKSKILQVIQALRAWEDRRKATPVHASSSFSAGPAGPVQYF